MFRRRITGFLLAMLLLVLAVAPIRAEGTLLHDSWYTLEQQGKVVGFEHDRSLRTDQGYQYIADATLQIELMGSGPVQATSRIEAEVDRDFHMLSFNIYTDTNGTGTARKGVLEDGWLTLTDVSPNGKEATSRIEVDEPLFFEDSFLDYLIESSGFEEGSEYSCRALDLSTMETEEYTVAVEGRETYNYQGSSVPVYSVVKKNGAGGRYLIGEDGECYQDSEPVMGVTARKVEKEDIPELQSMTADALIVPADMQVPFPFRTVQSRIEVTWGDISFEEFSWGDNRQKLVGYEQTEEGQSVLVEISRDDRDFTGRVSLPVEDEDLQPYMAETPYISSALPAVRELADRILGGETDGWRATQKLVQGVFDYIEPAVIPETLATEQILEKKQGKCVEYAVLFAALARASGLPTRLALGERYQDGMWVGHMWDEVWLGEWVAVDPSHNQSSPDALLLKLVDSATVQGTQKVRIALIGQLGISIGQVRSAEEDQGAMSGMETGIDGRVYTNVDYRCRLSAPEGWTLLETSEQGLPELVILSEEGTSSTIFLMFSVPAGTSADLIMSARIQNMKNVLADYNVLGQEQATLAGQTAAVGTWTYTSEGETYQEQNWIVITGDSGYLLVFTSREDAWKEAQPGFEEMRDGLQLY